MRAICEMCKGHFKGDDLIDLRIDQYLDLHKDAHVDVDVSWVQICVSCYEEKSETYPNRLIDRFPAMRLLDVIDYSTIGSPPEYKITLYVPVKDWDKMKYEFHEAYRE